MRAVFDTNVLVSALLFRGKPREALVSALEGAVQLYISQPMLSELQAVLSRPKFRLMPEQAALYIEEVQALCLPVFPREKAVKACRDHKDHIVLECALESRCDFLVTGDKDLLVLKSFRGIPIVNAAEFLDRIAD